MKSLREGLDIRDELRQAWAQEELKSGEVVVATDILLVVIREMLKTVNAHDPRPELRTVAHLSRTCKALFRAVHAMHQDLWTEDFRQLASRFERQLLDEVEGLTVTFKTQHIARKWNVAIKPSFDRALTTFLTPCMPTYPSVLRDAFIPVCDRHDTMNPCPPPSTETPGVEWLVLPDMSLDYNRDSFEKVVRDYGAQIRGISLSDVIFERSAFLEKLPHLVSLELRRHARGNQHGKLRSLAALEKLPWLKRLLLDSSDMELKDIPAYNRGRLQILRARPEQLAKIEDDVQFPALEELALVPGAADKAMGIVGLLPQLRKLHLKFDQAIALVNLPSTLCHLELYCPDDPHQMGGALQQIATQCPQLESLVIIDSLSREAVLEMAPQLNRFSKLRALSLCFPPAGQVNFPEVELCFNALKEFKGLHELHLKHFVLDSENLDEFLSFLSANVELRQLTLNDMRIMLHANQQRELIEVISKLPHLAKLRFDGMRRQSSKEIKSGSWTVLTEELQDSASHARRCLAQSKSILSANLVVWDGGQYWRLDNREYPKNARYLKRH